MNELQSMAVKAIGECAARIQDTMVKDHKGMAVRMCQADSEEHKIYVEVNSIKAWVSALADSDD